MGLCCPAVAPASEALQELNARIVVCRRCPRLVWWREEAARRRPRRYAGETYWARPLPGWGDPLASILIVGLAPAAHGGNRTGRIFTGDRSGDFLFAALARAGLANQPTSERPGDGLEARGVYIGAVNRCAPPDNRPTPAERDNCLPYLAAELSILPRLGVVLALGAWAWQGSLMGLAAMGLPRRRPAPAFGHGREIAFEGLVLVGSYHPSQQNTFTGRLTPAMFDAILARCLELAAGAPAREERLPKAPVRSGS
jgi:uracil-DNA glycosylase family 4